MAETKNTKLTGLIDRVIKEDGSDLHLSVGRRPTLRVSGELIPLAKKDPLTEQDTQKFAKELLTEEQEKHFLEQKEIDFSYSFNDRARFRCNCFFEQGTVGIAMRLIPREIRGLKALNLPDTLRLFTEQRQGFFLVVGPVGMGKTTTLASMLNIINESRAEHIITIEDPIEYLHDQKKSIVDQREVRKDTKSFESGLRNVFRQDVDVVMIGEMRGPETISTAVTAAETGHLVFSTLHTNNASQTIDRIIDSFPAKQQNQIRTQLAGSLSGVFSQRLVPRVSGGRVPAYELLINNSAVANLIREGRTHEIDSVIDTHLDEGMISMNRSLVELVRSGEVQMEEARKFSLQPDLFDRML